MIDRLPLQGLGPRLRLIRALIHLVVPVEQPGCREFLHPVPAGSGLTHEYGFECRPDIHPLSSSHLSALHPLPRPTARDVTRA
ncbi:hypothetical protein [Paracoccus actinidiae]|uniref:hypothetical protein n=1 Tax=Paracoccus actinidiae TaxID=3064531 RepID=UPI0027D2FB87|nr:hypothetical protein [Paracoccus sp. M09]